MRTCLVLSKLLSSNYSILSTGIDNARAINCVWPGANYL